MLVLIRSICRHLFHTQKTHVNTPRVRLIDHTLAMHSAHAEFSFFGSSSRFFVTHPFRYLGIPHSMARGSCCVVYVREARHHVIERMKAIAGCVHNFRDEQYNRTSFYFISKDKNLLVEEVIKFCSQAYQMYDEDGDSDMKGSHPCLGFIDNIAFSPLIRDSVIDFSDEKSMALNFCSSFQDSKYAHIPFYLYNEASPTKRRLKDIRKSLGYFNNTNPLLSNEIVKHSNPDYYIEGVASDVNLLHYGVCCIGVMPLIVNFNIVINDHISKRSSIVQVTKELREENAIEALTLNHGTNVEIACNLLNGTYTPEQVTAKALSIIQRVDPSVIISDSYTTGPSVDELLKLLNM